MPMFGESHQRESILFDTSRHITYTAVRKSKRENERHACSFNDPSLSEGSILLEVVLGKLPFKRTAYIEFLVVKANSQYNVILGLSAMMTFGAVTSTVHGMMKFPTPSGIATLYEEQRRTIECVQLNRTTVKPIIHEDGSISPNPAFPDQKIIIGSTLIKETKEKLFNILTANIDVFVWQVSDMTGVPRHISEHKLNMNPNIPPVCQKKRGMTPERTKFLREKVKNLVEAGILREVNCQTWLANPVLVRKPDNTWRMCVYFTDINKACLKDNYPLPEMDWKVESLSGYPFKSFFGCLQWVPSNSHGSTGSR
ncbi:uncharacterized protein [Rutidosis leptorrhynchoides]|uniref:uncharacterized protein n=1 Tax=Rutidosis leptorrhynchoides TaxID=125765 RepID=UPI003A998B8B